MFRKKQDLTEAKPEIRPIDTLLDEAIKNYQLDEAKKLLRTCHAKIINPDNLLDVIFGVYDDHSDKRYNLTYRYKNRLSNPPPSTIKTIRSICIGLPDEILIVRPKPEEIIHEIRQWIEFGIEAGCVNAKHRVWGDTMLMWAVANRDSHSVKRLLVANANVFIKNNLDQPVSHIAILFEDKEILSLINAAVQEQQSAEKSALRCHIL